MLRRPRQDAAQLKASLASLLPRYTALGPATGYTSLSLLAGKLLDRCRACVATAVARVERVPTVRAAVKRWTAALASLASLLQLAIDISQLSPPGALFPSNERVFFCDETHTRAIQRRQLAVDSAPFYGELAGFQLAGDCARGIPSLHLLLLLLAQPKQARGVHEEYFKILVKNIINIISVLFTRYTLFIFIFIYPADQQKAGRAPHKPGPTGRQGGRRQPRPQPAGGRPVLLTGGGEAVQTGSPAPLHLNLDRNRTETFMTIVWGSNS